MHLHTTDAAYEATQPYEKVEVVEKKDSTLKDVIEGKATMGEFVAQMSVEELAALNCGSGWGVANENSPIVGSNSSTVKGAAGETTVYDQYGIPGIVLADGPGGVRVAQKFDATIEGSDEKQTLYQYCTAWPVSYVQAQTWDTDLVKRIGVAFGKEVDEMNITLLLGPSQNIHRDPLCGRNFEYYSEDPVVSGVMAAACTLGVQETPGVGACLKHFAANNQESNRNAVDTIVSERTLREIYLKGFEIAVKESRPMSIMTSYNLINGVPTADSYDLCTNIARGEWGFDGLIMTDWNGGSSTPMKSMHAGNDLVMPGRTQDRMIAALQGNPVGTTADPNLDKTLVRGDIQKCVSRVLTMIMRSSQFGKMNSKVDVKAHTETYDNLVTYSSVKKEEVKTTAVKKLEDELKKAQEKADKLEKELGEANQKTQAANKEVEKLQAKLDVRTKNIRLKSAKSKKAKQATIRWAKVKNVDGYVVEYSTKANMKSAKKKNVKASTISLTVKNLKKGKKYYVRVRGYKVIDGQKVYTQYSAKKAVKIKK